MRGLAHGRTRIVLKPQQPKPEIDLRREPRTGSGMGCRHLKSGDFPDQESEGLVEARCNLPEGRETTGDPEVQGSQVMGGRGRSAHPSSFGRQPSPSPESPQTRACKATPQPACSAPTRPPTPDPPQLPFLLPVFTDLGTRVLFCNLSQAFPPPSLSFRSLSGILLRAEVAESSAAASGNLVSPAT